MLKYNSKLKKYSVLFLLFITYISLLVYDLINLISYNQKISLNLNPFPQTSFMHEYIARNLKGFCKHEKIFIFSNIFMILKRIFKIIFFVSVNFLVFNRKSREFILKKGRFINNCVRFGMNDEVGLYRFLTVFSLIYTFFSETGPFYSVKNPFFLFLTFTLLYFLRTFLIPKRSVYVHRGYFGVLSFFFQISYYFIFMTIRRFMIFKNVSKKLPEFLNGEALEKAVHFFGEENIFHFRSQFLNISSEVNYSDNRLNIYGDWSFFSKKEFLSIILHEIGHGTVDDKYFYVLVCVFTTTIISLIYYEITYRLSLCDGKENTAKRRFIFLFNFYIFLLCDKILNSLLDHYLEFKADNYSQVRYFDGKLIDALYRLTIKNDLPIYKPYFFSKMHLTHPSCAERIERLGRNN